MELIVEIKSNLLSLWNDCHLRKTAISNDF